MGRQSDLDNHANQMNPNNDAYYQSRGEDGRPDDWDDEDDDNTVVVNISYEGASNQ